MMFYASLKLITVIVTMKKVCTYAFIGCKYSFSALIRHLNL